MFFCLKITPDFSFHPIYKYIVTSQSNVSVSEYMILGFTHFDFQKKLNYRNNTNPFTSQAQPNGVQVKAINLHFDSTFTILSCTEATDSTTDFANQLKPTLTRCSSVGNLIKYASFLAALTKKIKSPQHVRIGKRY